MSKRRIVKKSPQIQTILVGGSNAQCYGRIVERKTTTYRQEIFLEGVLEAIEANIPNFRVPVYDPSISNKDEIVSFVPGAKPAIGYSYDELRKIAQKNNLKLGSKYQYHLFIATMILLLMDEGLSEDEAWKEMCDDSEIINPKGYYEPITGSNPVAGKYDLGTTFKVLKQDADPKRCWIAGTIYYGVPAANIINEGISLVGTKRHYLIEVGWFVLDENDERALKSKEKTIYSNSKKNKRRVSTKYETISVLCSRSAKYERLITFDTSFEPYKDFQEMLKYVMGLDIPAFKVPVYFPTLDEKGLLQFINMPGLLEDKKPLVELSYNQCKELAKKSGVRLGTRNEYTLFIATLILDLINSGKSDEEAWDIMYNYWSTKSNDKLYECLRADYYKILANDVENDTYHLLAGGRYFARRPANPIWAIFLDEKQDYKYEEAVGWFVF